MTRGKVFALVALITLKEASSKQAFWRNDITKRFHDVQKERINLDVPLDITSAAPAILNLYEPVINYDLLQNHGCWCSHLNPDNPKYIGQPIDELDRICQDWMHARRCVKQESICKNEEVYQSTHRFLAYTKYLGRGEWNFQVTPQMDCINSGHQCKTNTCKIDQHFLSEIFAASKLQIDYMDVTVIEAHLNPCQLPKTKKLLLSSEQVHQNPVHDFDLDNQFKFDGEKKDHGLQSSQLNDRFPDNKKTESSATPAKSKDNNIQEQNKNHPIYPNKIQNFFPPSQLNTFSNSDPTESENDAALLLSRGFTGGLDTDFDNELFSEGNSEFKEDTDLSADFNFGFEKEPDSVPEWMNLIESISYGKKKHKTTCIDFLTTFGIHL